ncbi:MAG: hypothetical protein PHU17_00210 [Candidatus Pacebacteria bacterium]|nr:hypothetical protein [Candidatus Paceibacterota bacterium]MDD4073951.1 hypothetical protein [Candidatus Paceibacterota bacterium]
MEFNNEELPKIEGLEESLTPEVAEGLFSKMKNKERLPIDIKKIRETDDKLKSKLKDKIFEEFNNEEN